MTFGEIYNFYVIADYFLYGQNVSATPVAKVIKSILIYTKIIIGILQAPVAVYITM